MDQAWWLMWMLQPHLLGRWLSWVKYHLALPWDGILTKPLWTRNFRVCNAMRLPMKIRESSTFEYVLQWNLLGSQVSERAIFQRMLSAKCKVTGNFRVARSRWGDGTEYSRNDEIQNMLCHLMAKQIPQEFTCQSLCGQMVALQIRASNRNKH